MSLAEISDSEFEDLVLGSDRLAVVLFSFEQEADLKMARILSRIVPDLPNDASFFVIKIAECSECTDRYEISATPMILFFKSGNVVGKLVGLHSRDSVLQEIDHILKTPVDQLPNFEASDLRVRSDEGEKWIHAAISGLVAGGVFGFSLGFLSGPLAFMIPAAAIGFLILSDNFGFSLSQKGLAIALMLAVGFYAPSLLQSFSSGVSGDVRIDVVSWRDARGVEDRDEIVGIFQFRNVGDVDIEIDRIRLKYFVAGKLRSEQNIQVNMRIAPGERADFESTSKGMMGFFRKAPRKVRIWLRNDGEVVAWRSISIPKSSEHGRR